MPSFIIIAGSAILALTSPNTVYAQSLATSSVSEASTSPTEAIRVLVEGTFGTSSPMVAAAGCESGFRQFDDSGKPLKNPGSSATGVFQILGSVHRASALKMGFDIDTVEGNIGYAKVLYDANGTVPWNESKFCWGRLFP